jgi:hypothetical protein
MTEPTQTISQPQNFSADFAIRITGLRTQTVAGVAGVVKQVAWTITGTEAGQTFELTQTTTVPDPDAADFVPLEQLTEPQVVAWIEAQDIRLPSIKQHIQLVLNSRVAEAALQPAAMPWAPAPQSPVEV